MNASTMFLNPWRRPRYGYVSSAVSGGVIWGVSFVLMAIALSFDKGALGKNEIVFSIAKFGAVMFLGSIGFEWCYAAVLRRQSNKNRDSDDLDVD
jgi:predicted cobalt transporter CbtA